MNKNTDNIAVHRGLIRKALKAKTKQTGRELERFLKYAIDYVQIMRRTSEVAMAGDKRACSTGKAKGNVTEWSLI
jgi:hypothetical protein